MPVKLKNFMKLYISLTSHNAEIILREGERVLVIQKFFVDNDLSQKILAEIDEMFEGVGKNPTDIEEVIYEAKDAGFTTERIGQVVSDTYNFVLGLEKKEYI